MKKLLFVVLLVGIASWYFVGGSRLSEDEIRDFYRRQERATLSRSPEDLCALLDTRFQAVVHDVRSGTQAGSMDREQTCEGYRKMYRAFDLVGDKMGGILQLDYRYTIHSIELASDRKSATVDVSYVLDVAGSIANIRSRSTETLIRKGGRVLVMRSEGASESVEGGA